MYPVWASEAASDQRLAEERPSIKNDTETLSTEERLAQERTSIKNDTETLSTEERIAEARTSIENDNETLSAEVHLLPIGRNCRINIADKHEIVRLNEELQDLQRWFEEYGQDGILFPNSIINSFAPRAYCQAA